MKTLLRAAAIAAVLSVLAGCGGQPIADSDLGPMIITMKGTEKIVDGDPVRAARVREIAAQVREYASNEALLTIDLLMVEIRRHVPWERLSPVDTTLIEALLIELRTRLVERYGETPLPADLQLSVETVSGWVILAARA